MKSKLLYTSTFRFAGQWKIVSKYYVVKIVFRNTLLLSTWTKLSRPFQTIFESSAIHDYFDMQVEEPEIKSYSQKERTYIPIY